MTATSSTSGYFSDRRRRNLGILAGIAALMVVLAGLALWNEEREVAPHYQPHTFFPHLASRVAQVSHLRIVSKKGTIDVVFRPERGWVVQSAGNYPASFEQVRQTVIGMATLLALEPKTARPDWLHYLDLDAPPHGAGIEVSLMNDKGEALAAVITGKSEDIGDQSEATGLFVREPGSNQSWLARSVFEPKNNPGDWLGKQVLSVDRARIEQVDVEPANGPAYEVRRNKPTDEDFSLINPPKGREIAYAGAPDGVGAAIVGFTFDDVQPAKEFDFSDQGHPTRLITRTFDGLTISVQTIQKGPDYWAAIAAEGDPGKPLAQKEARNIASQTTGWAYKLPPFKGQLFMTSLESLLKPPAGQQPNKPAQ